MAVRGANHDVIDRDARFQAGAGAGIGRDMERQPDQITADQSDLFFALLDDERFGLERVVGAGGDSLVEIARHAIANGRGDVDFGRPDAKGVFGALRVEVPAAEAEQDEEREEVTTFHESPKTQEQAAHPVKLIRPRA